MSLDNFKRENCLMVSVVSQRIMPLGILLCCSGRQHICFCTGHYTFILSCSLFCYISNARSKAAHISLFNTLNYTVLLFVRYMAFLLVFLELENTFIDFMVSHF
jgi:hypothetical protein